MACVIYRRVSTDEQVESGAGLAAQLDTCLAFAGRNEWPLRADPFTEQDGLKGDTPLDRCPALGEAVDALRPGDILLVYKRDRIARDRVKVAMLEALLKGKKCRLVSTQGEGTETADPNDPTAFLMRGIIDLFAEFEKLLIRFRTAAALRAKRRRNERAGRIPYGWDLVDDGRRSRRRSDGTGGLPIGLVPNEGEQKVLAMMRHLRSTGRFPYRAIARWLNERGIVTKKNKPWTASAVHHVLTREPHGATNGAAATVDAG